MVDITAKNRHEIRNKLADSSIRFGQLDVNGRCNAKCWFCPVKYIGNPTEFMVQMTVKDLDHILSNIRSSPLISEDFNNIATCHYNEVLLYSNFTEMINIFRRYNFSTGICSNGTPLTPDKTDIIIENPDIIKWISLNIPSIEKNDWSRKSGMSMQLHDGLMRNLNYLHENYNGKIDFQINSSTDKIVSLKNGIISTDEQLNEILESVKIRYPRFNIINKNNMLVDRAGILENLDVLRLKKKPSTSVIGCRRAGSRIFEWVHINAKGDLFLCCDDYNMEYRFGNLLNQSLEEAWLSEEHIDAITRAFTGICMGCESRINSQ